MQRNRDDLLALAGRYATERRAPVATIVKEILHYEILYALLQSNAIPRLTFQGGTALRLCYQGTRYSEDLDFAGGKDFDPGAMVSFGDFLKREIGEAYGLEVDIKEPKATAPTKGVSVKRWNARVHVPQVNRNAVQKQVINIEVASVPAYEPDLMPVQLNYAHLPRNFSQMLIPVETLTEILADKIVALGARDHFKARDIWDIKFLLDRNVQPHATLPLVSNKLIDYGWTEKAFKNKLSMRIAQLGEPETLQSFHEEMSRFVDSTVASQLAAPLIGARYLQRSADLGQQMLDADLTLPGHTPRP